MTLLCKIRQLLRRKVDKRCKLAFSLLALLKINFKLKYYKLYYNGFKLRVKVKGKVMKKLN